MRALFGIGLQCKHFHLLANPLLYDTFIKPASTDRADHLSAPVVYPVQKANARLRKYLRTLLSRSDLAQLVKTLILQPWHTKASLSVDPLGRSARYSALFVPQGEDLLCFPRSLMPLSRTNSFWNDFRAGNEDAEVALLLHLTCNIEDLDISFHGLSPDQPERFYFRQLLQEAVLTRSEHPFKNLRRLSAGGPADDLSDLSIPGSINIQRRDRFDITNIAELISLPSINELVTYGASDDSLFTKSFAGGHTNIAPMSLLESRISVETLTFLVNSCECLKSFDSTYSGGGVTTWRNAMASISGQSDNIEYLSLDSYMHGWKRTEMGNLKQMHNLKHLCIGEDTLIGDDATWAKFASKGCIDCKLTKILPPSLETLTILQATFACVPALEGLLVSLPQDFPNLRAIALGLTDNPQTYDDVSIDEIGFRFRALERGFEELSIEFVEEMIDYYEHGTESNFKEKRARLLSRSRRG